VCVCVCVCVWRGALLVSNREDFRVAAYLAKSIAYMTLEPHLVEVGVTGAFS